MTESTRISPDDVWIFIYRRGEVSFMDLFNHFVGKDEESRRKKRRRCAKQTLLNYKKALENQGKIKKKISKKTGRPVYYIPEEFIQAVKILIEQLEIKENLNKLSLEELIELKKELKEEEEDGTK